MAAKILTLGTALAMWFAVAPAVRIADASSRCRPTGAKAVTANRHVVVYKRRGEVYGCHRRSRRVTKLTPPSRVPDYYTLGTWRLAGTMVAYVATRHIYSGSQSRNGPLKHQEVVVRDLRTRTVSRHLAGAEEALASWFDGDGVRDLAITRRGTLAWIIRNPEAQPRTLQLYLADRRGRQLLDAGDGIDTRSLRLDDTLVRWSHGSEPRSAPVEP